MMDKPDSAVAPAWALKAALAWCPLCRGNESTWFSCPTCAPIRAALLPAKPDPSPSGASAANAPRYKADVEPHIRTEGEIQDLYPRMEKLADKLCQTSGLILWALKEAGLTIVRLDPHAREVAPE